MNDNLREKFPVGWRRGTEERGEGHPRRKEKFEQRPEVCNVMVVCGGVVRISCGSSLELTGDAEWKMRRREVASQIGS